MKRRRRNPSLAIPLLVALGVGGVYLASRAATNPAPGTGAGWKGFPPGATAISGSGTQSDPYYYMLNGGIVGPVGPGVNPIYLEHPLSVYSQGG